MSTMIFFSKLGRSAGLCIVTCLLITITGCEKAFDLESPSDDPVVVFEEAWNVMDQRYAMFPVKSVDWKEKFQQYRSLVTNQMTSHALFRVIGDMLESLQDGHVVLLSDQDTSFYDNFYKAYPVNFNYSNIRTTYLGNSYSSSGPVIYKIVDNTGYLYYNSFYNDITDGQLDRIFDDLKQTKGLIIDVRNNTGGNSGNADRLFRRFITERTLVKYELKKNNTGHNDFYEPEPFYLLPQDQAYTKPVALLTNRSCFSACNDFVSYMSGLKNVTQMGDQTGGGGGIPHSYLLKNGWQLRYTATVTLSPEKKSIENGIPPDLNIGISSFDEATGRDPILEQAFRILQ